MKQTYIRTLIKAALAEDIGSGDVTSNALVPANAKAVARLIFKSQGVVCGLDIAERVFKTLNPKISFKKLVKEGAQVKPKTAVAMIKGPAQDILSAERVAINFLTHLSSIATKTRAFADAVKPYHSKIYDTRKTTPLFRLMERYAVKIGGGENNRFSLADMAMIKDNHRLMLGKQSFKQAVSAIKSKANKKVILEVDTYQELKEALTSGADIILLDNMTPAQVHQAVVLRNQINKKIPLEASGGIHLDNVKSYAKVGVERISVGSLTSFRSGIDVSLDFAV